MDAILFRPRETAAEEFMNHRLIDYVLILTLCSLSPVVLSVCLFAALSQRAPMARVIFSAFRFCFYFGGRSDARLLDGAL